MLTFFRRYGLLLLTSLLWAGNFIAGKYTAHHATPMMLTELRYGIASIILLPIVLRNEPRLLPPKQAVWPLIGMGLTGVVLFNVFMFLALERTSANNVGLLSALNPVAIALVAFFVHREKLSLRKVAAMLVSLAGVAVVISGGKLGNLLELKFNAGDLFMLAAVLAWGFYSVIGARAMREVTPTAATMWAGFFGSAMLIPALVMYPSPLSALPSFWLGALYIAVGGTVIAMVLWNVGVKQVGGTLTGMFLNFNPIFTAILSSVMLDERMSALQAVGTAIVIAGVVSFVYERRGAVPAPAVRGD